MHRLISRASFLFVVLFALLTSAHGQQTGSIIGTVADPTGAVVPHAKVTLINKATADTRDTTTNRDGFFSFSAVVTGDYSVKVASKGFSSAEQSGIHISPGDRRNVNVSLQVGAGTEIVTVKASSAVTPRRGPKRSWLPASAHSG